MVFIEAVAGEEIRAGQLVYREAGGRVFAARSPKYPVRHMDRRGRVWTKQRVATPGGVAMCDSRKDDRVDVMVRGDLVTGMDWRGAIIFA